MPTCPGVARIRSCDVDKKLIRKIQRFLRSETPSIITNLDPTLIPQAMQVRIVDREGIHIVTDIDRFQPYLDTFENGTSEVSIGLSVHKPAALSISVRFTKSRKETEMCVLCGHGHEQKATLEIQNTIRRIIGEHGNNNQWFHPPGWAEPLFLEAPLLTIIAAAFLILHGRLSLAATVMCLAPPSILWCWFLPHWRPYCSFDTVQHRATDRILGFIVYGVFASCLGSVLLMGILCAWKWCSERF